MFDLKKLTKDLPEKEADNVLKESGRIKEVLDDQGKRDLSYLLS